MTTRVLMIAGLMAATAMPSLAWAQEAAPRLDEIVVTARKQEERLLDVPLSVSALGNAEIEAKGIGDLGELALNIPSMTFNNSGQRTYGQLLFRGMSNAALLDTTLENASVFVDGVYYVGSLSALDFADLERVEVIRGPQSAFFGRATFSGAVNFVTRVPSVAPRARISVEAAQHNDYTVAGSAEGALGTDKLTGRLSARYHDYGGFYTNSLNGQKLGQRNDKSITAVIVANPVDTFTFGVRGTYLRQEDGPSAGPIAVGSIPQYNCGPFGGINRGGPNRLFCGTVSYDQDTIAKNSIVPAVTQAATGLSELGFWRDYYNVTANADWEFWRGHTLSSLTGLSRESSTFLDDGDYTAVDAYLNYASRRQKSVSQEVRVSSPKEQRLRWLAGAYYLKQNYYTLSNFVNGSQHPQVLDRSRPNGFVSPASPNDKTITNTAFFGSVALDLLDNLTLSVEGRRQEDKVTAVAPAAPGGKITLLTKATLPRVILDFKPREGLTLYGNVGKGNKPTQANPDIIGLSAARQDVLKNAFKISAVTPEETLWNYEVGAKGSVFDNRATFSISAFYMQWRDRQGRSLFSYDFNGNGIIDSGLGGANRESFNSIVYPAGDANVHGFEFEGRAAVTSNLTIAATASYAKTKYTKLEDSNYFNLFGTFDASNQDEPKVPTWQGSVSADYRRAYSDRIEWFAGGDVTYSSSRWEDFYNKARTGDIVHVNVRAGVSMGRSDVTFFVQNLLDDRTIDTIGVSADLAYDPLLFRARSITINAPQPRQIGVRANYNF